MEYESESVDKKNWDLVEDAKASFTQQKWEQAISLFRKSRSICAAQQWLDGIRYADEMIQKATIELQKALSGDTSGEPFVDKKIRVICPMCHKSGIVQVDPHIMSEALETQRDYLVRVRVFEGEICDHEFIALVDPNFKAR